MSGLLSAIDELASADLELIADCERGSELRELYVLRERLDAQISRRLACFDVRGLCEADGLPSTQSWLRSQVRMAPSTASAEVKTSRGLRALPATAAAWEAGEISRTHAQAIAALAMETSVDATAKVESELVEVARLADPLRFANELRAWREAWRRENRPKDESDRNERRELTLADSFDGMTSLKGWLTPEVADLLRTVLGPLAAPLPAESRTARQRNHDALGEACRRLLAEDRVKPGAKVRPSLLVLCTAEGLRDGLRREAARLGYGNVISNEVLQRLACDSTVTRVLLGSTGEVLDLGRSTRTVSPAQWKALVVRDGGCVVPGCDRPATWCDAHHLVWWTRGGATDLDNLALVCGYHHGLIHEHGWTLGRDTERRWVFRRPDGSAVHTNNHNPTAASYGRRRGLHSALHPPDESC
jgi:hypothetical protein